MRIPPPSSDFFLAALIIVACTAPMVHYEFFEWWYDLTRQYETWQLDEAICVLFGILLAGTVMEVRHNRRLSRALADLSASQQSLITSKKEEFQSKKMAALGQLSSGIAHEINNALQPVLGLSQVIILNAPQENPLVKEASIMIHESARHMRMIVQNILSFSRTGSSSRHTTESLKLLKDTLDFSTSVLPSSLEFNIVYKDGAETQLAVAAIQIDRTELIQVFTNILANSAHAMKDTGTITITISTSNENGGDYLRVCISDTGCGMDKGTMDRIFEPFYTTKPEGEGTGLGMSTVYGIIKSWGGSISVSSTLGIGTDIAFTVPLNINPSLLTKVV